MNIYFFFNNESSRYWYDCTIEAWYENENTYNENKQISSFSLLERLHIHNCKQHTQLTERKKFHAARIGHELGHDLCSGHRAESAKEFIQDMTERMKQTNHRTFQRFKKAMLKIHSTYPQVNYVEELFKESPLCRILL